MEIPKFDNDLDNANSTDPPEAATIDGGGARQVRR